MKILIGSHGSHPTIDGTNFICNEIKMTTKAQDLSYDVIGAWRTRASRSSIVSVSEPARDRNGRLIFLMHFARRVSRWFCRCCLMFTRHSDVFNLAWGGGMKRICAVCFTICYPKKITSLVTFCLWQRVVPSTDLCYCFFVTSVTHWVIRNLLF